MNILITGGSGFLGINLIRECLKRGMTVRSIDKEQFAYPEADRIESVIGNIQDAALVNRCMNGIDYVIHCAAALPLYPVEEIFSTDIDGTKNVLETAYVHGVSRVVHISSTAVYGIPDHHPLYEDDPLQGVGPYGKAKIRAEEICQEYRKKGMCVSILRPKSFVGPERLGVFALFYEWAHEGRNFPILGNGRNRYQLLDVSDLCDAIFLCLEKNFTIANDTFNIGAKEFRTMKEDYQAVLNRAGFKKRVIGIPARPAIFLLRILEKLHLSPLYKWIYETAAKDSFVSIEKAEKILGFSPKYSNTQALVRNYEWYIKHCFTYAGKTGVSHRVPWKQGLLGLIKFFF